MAGQERELVDILRDVKQLAQEYYRVTGRPLGVTGEVGEFEAAEKLGIKLTTVRQAGYDAVETVEGSPRKLQIKSRCLQPGAKKSQRLGKINRDGEWNAILMVLLDANFEPTAIYEADRDHVLAALSASESKALKRGQLGVSKLKAIGRLRWSPSNERHRKQPVPGSD